MYQVQRQQHDPSICDLAIRSTFDGPCECPYAWVWEKVPDWGAEFTFTESEMDKALGENGWDKVHESINQIVKAMRKKIKDNWDMRA